MVQRADRLGSHRPVPDAQYSGGQGGSGDCNPESVLGE